MEAATGDFGATFTAPQVILFSADVERASAFYRRLGFQETFRVPDDGAAIHVDLTDGHPIQLVQRLASPPEASHRSSATSDS